MNDFFNNLFNNVLSDTSELAVTSSLIAIFAAALFGFVIAFTYYRVSEESYGRSLAVTLVMLPVILSVIILFVGSNVARAFSLAGTLSIIRFRSARAIRRISDLSFSILRPALPAVSDCTAMAHYLL